MEAKKRPTDEGICPLHRICMEGINKKLDKICAKQERCDNSFTEVHKRIDGSVNMSTFRILIIVLLVVLAFLCSTAVIQVKSMAIVETNMTSIKEDMKIFKGVVATAAALEIERHHGGKYEDR